MEKDKRIQEDTVEVKQESQEGTPQENKPDSPKEVEPIMSELKRDFKHIFTKRTIAEIIVGAVLIIGLISTSGNPTKHEYAQLKEAYDEQAFMLELDEELLDGKSTEYSNYKEKMSKFEKLAEKGLSEDDVDALISKADEIIAENKAKKEAEEKAAQEAAAEEAKEEKIIASATLEQKNALERAKSYLNTMAFSKKGLIGQLEYEGYSKESATFAVNHCGADWNEQAAKKAEDYMDTMSFSKQGLIDQLEYEGFTKKQAQYGAKAVGY